MGGDFLGGLSQGVSEGLQSAQQQSLLKRRLKIEEETAKYQRKHLEGQTQLNQMKIEEMLRQAKLGEQFAGGFEPTTTQMAGPPPIEPSMAPEDISPEGPMITQIRPGPFAEARGLSPEQGKMMGGLIRVLGGDVEKAGKAFEFFFPDTKADKLTEPFLAYQATGQGPQAERAKQAIGLLKPVKPEKSEGYLDELTKAMTQGQFQSFAVAPPNIQSLILKADEERKARIMAAGPVQAEREKFAQRQVEPLPPSELGSLVDPKALREGRIVRPMPGSSLADIRKQGFVAASTKQLEEITALDNVEFTLSTMKDLSDRIFTATDATQAAGQKLRLETGALTKDTVPSLFKDEVNAYLGNLSRAYGGERGVLTNQDIARIRSAFPTFGDTVVLKDLKFSILDEINNVSRDAKVRVIAGDAPKSTREGSRKVLDTLLNNLEHPPPRMGTPLLKGTP